MPARFYDQDVASRLKDKRRLSSFLDKLVSRHRKNLDKIQLTYIFCNDKYVFELNKEFLQHDTFTDIVTFDLSEHPDELVGEIYISSERVAENAEKFHTDYNSELHRVIFHGALHLCGFQDKTEAEKKEMRSKEDLCLKQYFKEEA